MITDRRISGPEDLFQAIPFARFLNLKLDIAGNELTTHMPFAPHLIGNPMLPALHGGALGAFLELTATAQLLAFERFDHIPKPVDVNVQYLRTGKPLDTYARARINRMGRTIANVEVWAWQEMLETPIATLQAHFLIS